MILATHGIVGSSIVQFTGLLDDYSGAAAAYSLRRLSASYSGSAIRVRRASDNTEQDIGFVNNELDTSTLASFCSGTNGFVKTWYDQSGNGRDATQTTAAYQPQIVSSGSVILENGKVAIKTGIDDFFTASSIISGTSARSIMLIGRTDSAPSSSNGMLSLNDITTPVNNGELYNLTSEIATRVAGNAVYNDDYQNNTTLLLEQYFSTGGVIDISTYLNATLLSITSSSNATINTLTGNSLINQLSYANGISGYYQEIIIYNSDQSSNRTGIETNINNFYSIY